jgi:hypothetical protein
MDAGLHYSAAKDLFDAIPEAGEDIISRPEGNESPLAFIATLQKSPTPEEAVAYTAYVLPKRKAVWWGHQCLTHLDHLLSGQDKLMLRLAEDWVREPEEAQRYRAMQEGMACKNSSPGVWIALAAGWSGGSLSAPEMARVPPPAALTPRAVNTGVMGILAKVDRKNRAATLKGFVDMGVSLAGR